MAPVANTTTTLKRGALHISKRLIASYVLDWLLILGIAATGLGFNQLKTTNKRPFSLQDPSISYPYSSNTVTLPILAIVALVAPAIITALVCLLFIPGPTVTRTTPKSLIWRRKLWEWNTAWMGLGLALASAFMITEGLKDLGGKPRPHAIAVCRPDLSAESIARHRVGGLGQGLDESGATPILVDWRICQETDAHRLRTVFASWPSGHSSSSVAGMLYLTLFLCAKFAVNIPFLSPAANAQQTPSNLDEGPREIFPSRSHKADLSRQSSGSSGEDGEHEPGRYMVYPPRNQAAAPPIYLLIIAVYLPIGTAAFVCVSRWFDFHHHGIDILSGALLGAFTAYFSFRYYHMPLRRGAGWAWGARSRQRAFWLGVGREGYVGDEGWDSKAYAAKRKDRDLENGGSTNKVREEHDAVTGPGVADQPAQRQSSRQDDGLGSSSTAA